MYRSRFRLQLMLRDACVHLSNAGTRNGHACARLTLPVYRYMLQTAPVQAVRLILDRYISMKRAEASRLGGAGRARLGSRAAPPANNMELGPVWCWFL